MRFATLMTVLGLSLLTACSPSQDTLADTGAEITASAPSTISQDPSRYGTAETGLRIGVVKQPFHGGRNVAEHSQNPDYLEDGGIAATLAEAGHQLSPIQTAFLTPEEDRDYGVWHRMGMANGHLSDFVAENERSGLLTVGLLGNCNSLMGMLAGFQNSGSDGEPLRVGLVWIDAHGDFNTPETTLSGMLGGMPVAVSAGLALERLRLESHLEVPIHMEDILMVAVRDTDSEEEELIQEHGLARISTEDIRGLTEAFHHQMERLSENTDIIYVHVDMDVLDPREVSGHGLTVANGPTSQELAAAISEIFSYPKAAGLGIASTPANDLDPGELSRQAAYRLIFGAVEGVLAR
jgi:arginase